MTGRVFVADNGEDAEWIGTPRRGARKSGRFLRRGLNVFQYKKRSVSETDRTKIVRKLRSELRGAIADVEERTGKTVASYVLFTNVDLTIEDQESLSRAIRYGRQSTYVAIMGAAQLAAALNSLPHLRSAYFVTRGFRTWEAAWKTHAALVFSGAEIDLVGRNDQLEQLVSWINDPQIRAIVLTGPPTIGKSRLALEATHARQFDCVEATETHAALVSGLHDLHGSAGETIILLDDPEPYVAQGLIREVLAEPQLKMLLTVPTSSAVAMPNFGFDDRVRQLDLEPLNDQDARKLLQSVGEPIDFGLETWITQRAGGVPGILLAAAKIGGELRERSGEFVRNVALELATKARRRFTEREFETLQLLSCQSYVGVEGEHQGELHTICEVFDAESNALLNSIGPLHAAGFLRRSGSYAAVVPPLLADHLAEGLFRDHAHALRTLLLRLDSPALKRFLRRLVQLGGPEAEAFWTSLAQPTGPFGTLPDLVTNASLFHRCASSLPPSFAAQVATALADAPLTTRLEISGNARRDLVWGLQQMLLRTDTSEPALRGLGELAEGENENYGNNATGLFSDAFHPRHSQMPLTLARRLVVLRSFMSSGARESRILVGLQACEAALRRTFTLTLAPSGGSRPPGTMPTTTYNEYWQYQRDILGLIREVTNDRREVPRRRAKDLLPAAAENLVAQGTLEQAVEALEEALDGLLDGDLEFDARELAEALWRGQNDLQKIVEVQPDLAPYLDRFAHARERLDSPPYSVRLRQLVGGWLHLDEEGDTSLSHFDRQSAKIEELARDACSHPSPLEDDSVEWLLSSAAQRAGEFWSGLGKHDTSRRWSNRVGELAQDEHAANAIQGYLHGWSQHDVAGAGSWFKGQADSGRISPRGILFGALVAEEADDAAARIAQLLSTQSIEAELVAGMFQSRNWLEKVSEEPLLRVLKAIAGPGFERAGLVPQLMDFRFRAHPSVKPSLADFLWRCLEELPKVPNANAEYYFDVLAARLTKLDPERGFALLDRSLRAPFSSQVWKPLWVGPRHKFWDILCEIDRTRALVIALDAALAGDSLLGDELLSDVIDVQVDYQVLMEFAAGSEEKARIVAGTMAQRPEGFWALAFGLVELYPNSQSVLSKLSWGLSVRPERI